MKFFDVVLNIAGFNEQFLLKDQVDCFQFAWISQAKDDLDILFLTSSESAKILIRSEMLYREP